MNNKLEVIGIDHGWSMMKTVTQVFVTGVKEITTTPALFGDVLEYDGKYYKIGTVRQEVKDTKVEDDSFYLLTLAAVAKELKKRGLSDAKVFLAVGLPLTRFGAERNAKVIEVGATTDTAKSLQAQQMMTDEAAPKYQALDDALQKLMALNISLGNAKRAQLRTVMIAALTIIIIVIAVSTIYSNSLSVAISKSIEKPLNELKDRFITFAEGDIDSPLPTVESEDEIKELVSGVSAMSDRIRVIIKDSGRMLNEMSEGNFAIDTECEEVYTGAFTDLLTGIRKMNEEIDTTVRGVDDASGQVLTGSTNLAEAAQSLAEGATDQAASVEEMQATINELTSGIKTTAEELGTAYDEAYKYAEIAEGSRGDMEVLVQAMSRINETSEKIGAIITQIEDIASQTNLLSLNASIEAARAGEAGKGFAVVADQIRNLAEQSAKSAVDSKALIEAAIHEVGDGNMYAEKASTSLREVVDGIQAIADSAKKIKEISIEQADSMEQVEATAERIAEVVQNNSAAAQETSATSEELTAHRLTPFVWYQCPLRAWKISR